MWRATNAAQKARQRPLLLLQRQQRGLNAVVRIPSAGAQQRLASGARRRADVFRGEAAPHLPDVQPHGRDALPHGPRERAGRDRAQDEAIAAAEAASRVEAIANGGMKARSPPPPRP